MKSRRKLINAILFAGLSLGVLSGVFSANKNKTTLAANAVTYDTGSYYYVPINNLSYFDSSTQMQAFSFTPKKDFIVFIYELGTSASSDVIPGDYYIINSKFDFNDEILLKEDKSLSDLCGAYLTAEGSGKQRNLKFVKNSSSSYIVNGNSRSKDGYNDCITFYSSSTSNATSKYEIKNGYISNISTNRLMYALATWHFDLMTESEASRNINWSPSKMYTRIRRAKITVHNGSTTSTTYGYKGLNLENTITVPTKTGYTFNGYYTEENGSGTKIYNSSGTYCNSSPYLNDYGDLYAYWVPKTYKITLDNQGADTAGTSSVTATFDSLLPRITIPSKTGYAFGGYFSGKNGTGTQYYDSYGNPVKIWQTTSASTLYAYYRLLSNVKPVSVYDSEFYNDYKQLEYIYNGEGQYIDTLFKAGNGVSLDIDFSVISYTDTFYTAIFGSRTSNHSNDSFLLCRYNTSTNTVRSEIGAYVYNTHTAEIDTRTSLTFTGTNMAEAGLNLYLFGLNEGGKLDTTYKYATFKLYSCRISKYGVIERDFIPVLKISENVCGLYDLQNGVFYPSNSGVDFNRDQDTFVPNLTVDDEDFYNNYEEVDYLLNKPYQFIDTGVKAKNFVTVDMDLDITEWNHSYGAIFGSRSSNHSANSFVMCRNASNNSLRSELSNNSLGYIDIGQNNRSNLSLTAQGLSSDGLNIYLFGLNQNDSYEASYLSASYKLYSCKIYEGARIERNFVPAVSKTNPTVAGLYDLHYGLFYPCQTAPNHEDENSFEYGTVFTRCNIILNDTGGTDGSQQIVAKYSKEMPSVSVPAKDYFTFTGYYLEKNGKGEQYYNSNGIALTGWDLNEDTELFANWIKTIGDFASEFLDKTANRIYCEGTLDNSIKDELVTSFAMVDEIGRTAFKEAEWIHGQTEISDNVINAKSRYCYMVAELGINDFLDLFTEAELKALMHRGSIASLFNDGEDDDSIILVVSLSILSITTISAYILFRKRKEE